MHVLQPEAREFYGLDELYAECEIVDWEKVDFPELPAEKV
ncbi:MAG: hypothetical protein GY930_14690 [bacterium]|nr:hypothetical protein [bacterium]